MDEVSGESLSADGVRKARHEEVIELKKHDVYKIVPLEECWLLRYDFPVAVPKHGHSKPWLLGDNAQMIYNASLLTLPANSLPLPCHTCFDTVVGGRCRPNKATVVVDDEDHSSVVLILLELCISRSGSGKSDSTNFHEAFLRFSGSY